MTSSHRRGRWLSNSERNTRSSLVTPQALDVLDRVVHQYGEPFADSSAIPSFHLAHLARRHVTVALTGDGGDESFAGYLRHRAALVSARLDQLPATLRRGAARVGRNLPGSGDRKDRLEYARRFLVELDKTPAERYSGYVSIFDRSERAALLAGGVWERVSAQRADAVVKRAWEESSGSNPVDVALEVDISSYLPGDLLPKMDIASMAYSLELRSPFLDDTVMEFAASLPVRYKARARGGGKRILKAAYGDLIPSDSVQGPKMGFAVPLGRWMREDLKELLHDVLLDPNARTSDYLSRSTIRDILESHHNGAADRSAQLWTLLILLLAPRRFSVARPGRCAPVSRFE